ncbi:MAG: hypothetical protein V3S25_05030 [Nitrospirales bacterium]
MNGEDNVLRGLLGEIATLMHSYPEALERRAGELIAEGKDTELAQKLMAGADAMRDSGNLYLTWGRHYAALSEGTSDASDATDEVVVGPY